jgi:endoglucanase
VVARNGAGLSSADSPAVQFTTRAEATAGCTVKYAPNSWNTGFTANITVTNSGTTAWTGWTLKFSFPGNQKVTQGWAATWSQTNADVTAVNLPWNGALAPGQSTTVGFNGTYSGTNTNPSAFTIGTDACK